MNNLQKFDIRIEEPCLENYSEPPEDALGELSEFEMGIRKFCFDCNHQVSIEIGDERIQVFLDPDICILLEDRLPEKIRELAQGKSIEIQFTESCWIIFNLVPFQDRISCNLKEFGYLSTEKQFNLDKAQVLGVLRGFIDEIMQLAVKQGYITQEDKARFLDRAFPTNTQTENMAQGSVI